MLVGHQNLSPSNTGIDVPLGSARDDTSHLLCSWCGQVQGCVQRRRCNCHVGHLRQTMSPSPGMALHLACEMEAECARHPALTLGGRQCLRGQHSNNMERDLVTSWIWGLFMVEKLPLRPCIVASLLQQPGLCPVMSTVGAGASSNSSSTSDTTHGGQESLALFLPQ